MAGFKSDDISIIQQQLDDNYRPNSIFKELIQNADDARAEHIHIGWISDWDENCHPLLNTDVIFALNDGGFSDKDDQSIQYLGLSAKGNDVGSIGTFGLGMKSVFHFCEAFFFISSDNQEARNGNFFVELLNPWERSGYHADWETHPIPANIIRQKLSFWDNTYERWFCVMLPLKTKAQLSGIEPIDSRMWTIGDIFSGEHDRCLANFTPLLKSLKELTFWQWNSKRFCPEEISRICFDYKGLVATQFPEASVPNRHFSIHGTVVASNSAIEEKQTIRRFFGRETLLDHPKFKEIKNRSEWPKKRNVATRSFEPQKGEPHCAALFSMNQADLNQRGELRIERAVFLPLTESEQIIACGGNLDFRLILHSNYFVDHGRRTVRKRSESDGDRIEYLWNERLDELGVYPLILPALEEFVEKACLSDEDIHRLTHALEDSRVFNDDKDTICNEFQWLRQVKDHTQGLGVWKKIEKDRDYFVLPTPPAGNLKLPFDVFPNLAKICQENCNVFVFHKQPRLTSNRPGKWNYELTGEILDSLGPASLTSQEGLSYLVEFLKESLKKLEESNQIKLKAFFVHSLMRLVGKHGLDVVKPYNDLFVNLLETIGNESIVTLDVNTATVQKLATYTPDVELTQILLPKDLLPANFKGGKFEGGNLKLSKSDIILNCLCHDSEIDPKIMARAALALIEKTDGNEDKKLETLGNYKLFSVSELGSEEKQKVSWKTLARLFSEDSLFEKGARTIRSFAYALCEAVSGQKVYILNRSGSIDPFNTLLDSIAPQLDRDFCVNILNNRPKLGSPEKREPLLKELVNDISESSNRNYLKAVRYLLHGSVSNVDDTSTYLLVDSNRDDDNICKKLTTEALRRCVDQWFIVPKTLGAAINSNQGELLKVKPFNSNLQEELLLRIDLDWITEIALTDNERYEILKNLTSQELFKRLPIHRNIDQRLVAIGCDRAYLCDHSDFQASDELESLVTLIECPMERNPALDYQKFLESWTPETALKEVLKSDNPSVFWADALNCLHKLDRNGLVRLTDELTWSCRVTSWIPTRRGPKQPAKLIIIDGIEEATRIILADVNSTEGFYGITEINAEFLGHPAFGMVKDYLVPKPDQAMMVLGDCLENSKDYWIGSLVDRVEESDFLDKFLLVFGQAPKELLPTGSILKSLVDADYEADTITERLLVPLAQPLSKLKIKKLLDFITTRHEEVGGAEKNTVIEVFNWYLNLLMKSTDSSLQDLSGIRLLNAKGNWESTDRLCINEEGIDASHLLNKTQAKILNEYVGNRPQTKPVPLENKPAYSWMGSDELRSYFQQFEDYISRRNVGALLSFMGKSQPVTSLAADFLGHTNLEIIRQRIKWKPKPLARGTVFQSNIESNLGQRVFKIYQVSDNGLYSVKNLLGNSFKTHLSKSYSSIFVGKITWDEGEKCYSIGVRQIHPGDFTRNRVSEVLRESARYLLNFHSMQPYNLENLWEEWRDTEQLDLKVAQDLILENSMLYFKQLGGRQLATLNELMGRWQELQHEAAEIKNEKGETGSRSQLETIEKQKKELLSNLRGKLEKVPEVQEELLLAVRQKIGNQFQYDVQSIPFELFQNADDASTELIGMVGSVTHPGVNCINLIWDESKIVFMHSGRAINQYTKGLFPSKQGKALRYDQDLENMLVLSCSDKGSAQSQVTGKFGLGFKSVFLVSRSPKVLSGSLGFEVVGGLYPRRLEPEDRNRLRNILEDQLSNRDGTIFEIAFEEKLKQRPKDATKRFCEMLPVLLVFSRQIKRCHVKDSERSEQITVSWDEKRIVQCSDTYIGNLHFSFHKEKHLEKSLVLRRSGHFGSLLMALGQNGVISLPDFIPTFWNLAPMDGLNFGIAINGEFDLDVGRAQLAQSPERHSMIVQQLGRDLGQVLKSLHASSKVDWASLRRGLRLAEDTSSYQFWNSFWILLGTRMATEGFGKRLEENLCKEIFWKTGHGMADLYENTEAIPSGLSGDYEQLTRLGRIEWCAKGLLDLDEKVFGEISNWETFRQRIPVNGHKLVSESRIKKPLEKLISRDLPWDNIDIITALKWELCNGSEVSPEKAEKFGKTINPDFLNALEDRDATRQERESLVGYLKTLKFKSSSLDLVSCQDLLISDRSVEQESMRAAFAPRNRVLHSQYGINAINFFMACRSKMHASVDLMARWGFEATNLSQQTAFLEYLVRGDLRASLQAIVRDKKCNTWLDSLSTSLAYEGLSTDEQKDIYRYVADFEHISGDFSYSEDVESLSILNPATHDYASHRSPAEILHRIFNWWEDHKNDYLPRYVKSLYPDNKFPDLEQNPVTGYNKKEWLKIFLLGCLQTLGFAGDETKREFVRICETKAWLSLLAESDQNRTGWLEEVDQYIDKQIDVIEHYHSMRQLLSVFFIGSRLEKYIRCLMAINQIDQANFALDQITSPRASSLFGGGGPDAPPLKPILGIGMHFVLRELYRNKILTHRGGYSYCYVPTTRLRKLFRILHWIDNDPYEKDRHTEFSKGVFRFLHQKIGAEKAIFDHNFDIPLQLVAREDALQEDLLGSTLSKLESNS
jgi:hypothetical protein